MVIVVAGTTAAVQILQEVYERVFGLEHRGWRDLWRFVVSVAVPLAVLFARVASGAQRRALISRPAHVRATRRG